MAGKRFYRIFVSFFKFLQRRAGFHPSTLSTAVFPQRFSFFTICLVHYLHEVPHGGYQSKTSWNLGLQFAGKCISKTLSDCRSLACTSFVCSDSNFSWNFRVFFGSFEGKLTRRVKWKRTSFITQFKIEFLLPLTGCRKVLGKMPGEPGKELAQN